MREVRDVMAIAEHVNCGSFQGQVARLIVDKLKEVDAIISQLTKLRSDLSSALQTLITNAGGCESSVLVCADCRCLGQP